MWDAKLVVALTEGMEHWEGKGCIRLIEVGVSKRRKVPEVGERVQWKNRTQTSEAMVSLTMLCVPPPLKGTPSTVSIYYVLAECRGGCKT